MSARDLEEVCVLRPGDTERNGSSRHKRETMLGMRERLEVDIAFCLSFRRWRDRRTRGTMRVPSAHEKKVESGMLCMCVGSRGGVFEPIHRKRECVCVCRG